MKALVVDDQAMTRKLVHRVLVERCGFTEVLEAGDGLEALEPLRSGAFDLAVVDIDMPRMDGFSLIAKVRESNPEQPFIVLSGFPARGYAERAKELGAFAYLEKDCSLAEITEIVLAAVAARSGYRNN